MRERVNLRPVSREYEVRVRTDRETNEGYPIRYVRRGVICDNVFKNGLRKICGRQPLKNLK